MNKRLIVPTALVASLALGACQKEAAPKPDNAAASSPIPSATHMKPTGAESAPSPELLQDAVIALNETQNALAAIDKSDGKAASGALERATGKLEIVLAKNPSLALAPVDVSVVTKDIIASVDTVEAARAAAKDAINDGRLQDARRIMDSLASETVVTVSNLPLATYPAAIKDAAALLAQNKLPEAKVELQAALSTIVLQDIVFPLPLMRAQEFTKQAKALAANAGRSSADDAKIHTLLDGAREQIKLGQALGYATKDDMKALQKAVDDIEESTKNKGSGGSFFDRISQLFDKARSESQRKR